MQELIHVNYDNAERPSVSGRELHDALGVETPYHKWFPRMCEYGFTENVHDNRRRRPRRTSRRSD